MTHQTFHCHFLPIPFQGLAYGISPNRSVVFPYKASLWVNTALTCHQSPYFARRIDTFAGCSLTWVGGTKNSCGEPYPKEPTEQGRRMHRRHRRIAANRDEVYLLALISFKLRAQENLN